MYLKLNALQVSLATAKQLKEVLNHNIDPV